MPPRAVVRSSEVPNRPSSHSGFKGYVSWRHPWEITVSTPIKWRYFSNSRGCWKDQRSPHLQKCLVQYLMWSMNSNLSIFPLLSVGVVLQWFLLCHIYCATASLLFCVPAFCCITWKLSFTLGLFIPPKNPSTVCFYCIRGLTERNLPCQLTLNTAPRGLSNQELYLSSWAYMKFFTWV